MLFPTLTSRSALAALALVTASMLVTAATIPTPGPGYHIVATLPIGGDGGWDYVAFDTVRHRLFVARGNRLLVLDPETGALLGEIPGINGAHGTALVQDVGHGFVTSGHDSTIVMFDLATLRVLGKTTAALDDDAILYDPASKRVFSFNGDSKSSTAVDPVTGKNIGTIDLGAGPEFGVSDYKGKLFVNLEDKGAIAEIDPKALRVTRQWSMAPCESPTGLAIDRVHHRLFSGCRSQVMAISDADAGKLITTLPIGAGVDAGGLRSGHGVRVRVERRRHADGHP